MRLSMLALLLAACAGGQTGEITDLTACSEPVGTTEVGASSEAGRSADEQLALLATDITTVAAWDGDPRALGVSFALTGEPATLLGGPDCVRPWLEALVTITLRTSDGALDESIDGVVLLTDSDAATVRGTMAADAMTGALELDEGATLRVDLLAEPDALGGVVSVEDAGDDRLLTSF